MFSLCLSSAFTCHIGSIGEGAALLRMLQKVLMSVHLTVEVVLCAILGCGENRLRRAVVMQVPLFSGSGSWLWTCFI